MPDKKRKAPLAAETDAKGRPVGRGGVMRRNRIDELVDSAVRGNDVKKEDLGSTASQAKKTDKARKTKRTR